MSTTPDKAFRSNSPPLLASSDKLLISQALTTGEVAGYAIAIISALILLSFERLFYIFAWYFPENIKKIQSTRLFAKAESPTDVVKYFFYLFKLLQMSVFAGWWYYFSDGTWTLSGFFGVTAFLATLAIIAGQILNFAVFVKLGDTAVFYGNRFGYKIKWQDGFPFNLISHPQYVGTVVSIWGVFALMRFPNDDWWIVPLIETVYYAAGARLEQ